LVQSDWATDEAHFEALIDLALKGNGPRFIAARIDDQKPAGTTERDPVKIRLGFMQALASNR